MNSVTLIVSYWVRASMRIYLWLSTIWWYHFRYVLCRFTVILFDALNTWGWIPRKNIGKGLIANIISTKIEAIAFLVLPTMSVAFIFWTDIRSLVCSTISRRICILITIVTARLLTFTRVKLDSWIDLIISICNDSSIEIEFSIDIKWYNLAICIQHVDTTVITSSNVNCLIAQLTSILDPCVLRTVLKDFTIKINDPWITLVININFPCISWRTWYGCKRVRAHILQNTTRNDNVNFVLENSWAKTDVCDNLVWCICHVQNRMSWFFSSGD